MTLCALLLCAVVLAEQTAFGRGGISALFTTGTYDGTGEANAVDREAAGNGKTLAEFKADVADAFRNDTGGVITFDKVSPGVDPYGSNGRSGNYPNDNLTVFLGAGQTSSMEISVDCTAMTDRNNDAHSLLDIWQGNRLGPLPISGPLIKHDGSPGQAGAFLTPGTGIDDDTFAKLNFSGAQIRQLGVTALSVGGPQVLTVTAYFSGGQSDSRTESIAAGFGKDDVFFYFAAPPRQTIVSLRWDSDVVNRPGIDDLALMFSAAPDQCTFILR